MTEIPFMLFGLAGVLAARVAYERHSWHFATIAGVLFGCGALIRPGLLLVVVSVSLASVVFILVAKQQTYRLVLISLCVFAAVLTPWYIRNHQLTGAWALTGQGWRNAYTDYLASMRSLERGTSFSDEKNNLKAEAMPRFGISRADLGNPANAKILRDAALLEMWQHKATVIKLETALLATFFFNDGYYFEFRHFGYLTDAAEGQHVSSTYLLIKEGIAAVPEIFAEMARQAFVPLWGRLFTVGTFLLGLLGFLRMRSRMRYALVLAIALFAVESTVIGFGVDARLRVPVEPFIFLFDGVAILWIREYLKKYAH